MSENLIKIRGARVHNLKNINLNIPKNKLVVITGVSGSGKSSLAFDTLYAEGQRRYVESLSAYARQFLGVMDKPEVDSIEGISPAISIDQRKASHNPRSTVGTITEIYDYLRLLFSRIGLPHCPECGKKVSRQTIDQIAEQVLSMRKAQPSPSARGMRKRPCELEITILGPVVRNKKGEHQGVLEEIQRAGFVRVRIDGIIYLIEEVLEKTLEKNKKHNIEVVVDRLVLEKDLDKSRLVDSLETALKLGKGIVIVSHKYAPYRPALLKKGGAGAGSLVKGHKSEDEVFSEHFACETCGISLPELEPRLFSFNSPFGACSKCQGLGQRLEVSPSLVIPNPNLTIEEGAIFPWAHASHKIGRQGYFWWKLQELAEKYEFSLSVPIKELPKEIIDLILYDENSDESKNASHSFPPSFLQGKNSVFEGVIPNLERRYHETDSEYTRNEIEQYMIEKKCEQCQGKRLKPEVLAVTVAGKSIDKIVEMQVNKVREFFEEMVKSRPVFLSGEGRVRTKQKRNRRETPKQSLRDATGQALTENELKIANLIIKEIINRLQFLIDVGLDYITLDRKASTLSGGEEQRIRLATQIGSKLTGVLYILDEPSVGLHPRDQGRLIETLKKLRDLGNTVIVVEHSKYAIKAADWIIDIGLAAGKHGGRVVFEGTPQQLLKSHTLTGDYLAGRKKVEIDSQISKSKFLISKPGRRTNSLQGRQIPSSNSQKPNYLIIKGAKEHNLKNIDVKIPLGKFVCLTGVSGSGKSSLMNDILARALMRKFYPVRKIYPLGQLGQSTAFSNGVSPVRSLENSKPPNNVLSKMLEYGTSNGVYKSKEEPGKHQEILGTEFLDKVVLVDQSPIGRTPRSNPVTYTGAFSYVRDLFSKTKEARVRGYQPGRFSFNVKGGRCEECEGQGVRKIEMYFLPDIYIQCSECKGRRFNQETLTIEYKGKNIADVLEMTVEEALEFFKNIPGLYYKLKTLKDVGLGYLELGQPAPSLSGGEAQRVKLATELSKKASGKTLYILDEPTTGLHPDDIKKLLYVLRELVNRGNTVVCIEHELDVIKNADYLIDLGPEGGDKGGEIVAEGSPAEIIRNRESYTGKYLKEVV